MNASAPITKFAIFGASFLICQLALCSLIALASDGTSTNSPFLSVKNGQITNYGNEFIVKGVQIVAFVEPSSYLRWQRLAAYRHFSPSLLAIARNNWNANTVRFQLSQPGLDPRGQMYSAEYILEIKRAVALAESLGFAVIVSVQDEGNPGYVGMPTLATLRADETLADLFGHDRAVMIDLYNEPTLEAIRHNTVITKNWEIWERGGVNNDGTLLVGMQMIIDTIRGAGAENILIVEGLNGGGILKGVPTINDPLNRYAFSVHPYLHGENASPENWAENFGFLVDAHLPVIAGEWSAPTKNRWLCKDESSLKLPNELLRYLRDKKIGIVGWSFDLPGTIVTDFMGTPTTFDGKQCGNLDGGPGVLLQQLFWSGY